MQHMKMVPLHGWDIYCMRVHRARLSILWVSAGISMWQVVSCTRIQTSLCVYRYPDNEAQCNVSRSTLKLQSPGSPSRTKHRVTGTKRPHACAAALNVATSGARLNIRQGYAHRRRLTTCCGFRTLSLRCHRHLRSPASHRSISPMPDQVRAQAPNHGLHGYERRRPPPGSGPTSRLHTQTCAERHKKPGFGPEHGAKPSWLRPCHTAVGWPRTTCSPAQGRWTAHHRCWGSPGRAGGAARGHCAAGSPCSPGIPTRPAGSPSRGTRPRRPARRMRLTQSPQPPSQGPVQTRAMPWRATVPGESLLHAAAACVPGHGQWRGIAELTKGPNQASCAACPPPGGRARSRGPAAAR